MGQKMLNVSSLTYFKFFINCFWNICDSIFATIVHPLLARSYFKGYLPMQTSPLGESTYPGLHIHFKGYLPMQTSPLGESTYPGLHIHFKGYLPMQTSPLGESTYPGLHIHL